RALIQARVAREQSFSRQVGGRQILSACPGGQRLWSGLAGHQIPSNRGDACRMLLGARPKVSGEDGIRTRGGVLPPHRFSKPALSAAQPPLRHTRQRRVTGFYTGLQIIARPWAPGQAGFVHCPIYQSPCIGSSLALPTRISDFEFAIWVLGFGFWDLGFGISMTIVSVHDYEPKTHLCRLGLRLLRSHSLGRSLRARSACSRLLSRRCAACRQRAPAA